MSLMTIICALNGSSSGSGGGPTEPTGTFQVMAIGDSLTAGTTDNNAVKSYPARLYAKIESLFPDNFGGYQNFGVPGSSLGAIGTTQVSSAIAAKGAFDNFIVLVGGGINDIGGGSPANGVYSLMKTAHQNAQAGGFQTIAITVSAHNYSGYGFPTATLEAVRNDLNDMIRAGWESDFGASALIDLDETPLGIYDPDGQDPVYFSDDELHWTDYGYQYMGEDVAYPVVISVST